MPPEASDRTVSARIIVIRDSPDDVQVRQIAVFVDGRRIGELLYGESTTHSVEPGRHTLRVDNTWNKKDLSLDLKAGETVSFRTKSTAGQFSRFLLVAFGAGPIYVSIERQS